MDRPTEIRSLAAGAVLAVLGTPIFCTPGFAQNAQAYCAKVVIADLGQPVPDNLIAKARRMFDLAAETADAFVQASTSIRCVDGAVWLCSYGANLICEKADVSRDSPGADGFCRQNPDSIGVPMSATGHATVFEWKCVGRKARIIRQSAEVDARGFIAGNWKKLQ